MIALGREAHVMRVCAIAVIAAAAVVAFPSALSAQRRAQDVAQCVEWSPRGYCIEWDVTDARYARAPLAGRVVARRPSATGSTYRRRPRRG